MILLVVVVVAVAAGGSNVSSQQSVPNTAQRPRQSLAPSHIPVQRRDIAHEKESSGTVPGARQADLGFTTSG